VLVADQHVLGDQRLRDQVFAFGGDIPGGGVFGGRVDIPPGAPAAV
jgi:hypothetical protein